MIKRYAKWLLIILIAAEVILIRTGILDTQTAIGVIIGIELLLMVVAARQIFTAIRQYRHDRTRGIDIWAAIEDGFMELLPRPVARAVAIEIHLWVCLGKWVLRKNRNGENDFPYHKKSILGTALIMVVFTTPAEVLLFEIIVPWEWLRVVLLIACIYALFWIFGLYASLVTLPHRLEPKGLRLNFGILANGLVPYENIGAVSEEKRKEPKGRDGLRLSQNNEEAYLAVGGKTDITLHLTSAASLQGFLNPTAPVKTIHFAADNPVEFVRQLRAMIE